MKTILDRLFLLILLVVTGCNSASSSPSKTSEVESNIDWQKNLAAAIQIIKIARTDSVKVANNEPVEPISFRELLEYLPDAPRGWSAQEPEGETNSFGNYSVSQVSQTYINDNKRMEVSIFDWAFNSALYMPFLLSTEFSQESTVGYNKGIKIDDMPGREEYNYQSRQGSLNLLVNSRFLVRIDGRNIEDKELREWWSQMDLPSLDKFNRS